MVQLGVIEFGMKLMKEWREKSEKRKCFGLAEKEKRVA